MTANELLEEALEWFSQQVEGVEFRAAWGDGWGSWLPAGPVVCGEVAGQRLSGGRGQVTLRFSVFAGDEARRAQVLEELWALLVQDCPGCGELRRGAGQTDGLTRQRYLTLEGDFSGEGFSPQGVEVLLGGKACRAAGFSITALGPGDPLVAVGEEEPFAYAWGEGRYQVELEGLQSPWGLERLASFAACVGESRFTGCRWKTLELPAGRAVFVAAGREEKEDGQ